MTVRKQNPDTLAAEKQRALTRLRAVLDATCADAEQTGASFLTDEDIIAEIREHRREKRRNCEAGSKDAVYPI